MSCDCCGVSTPCCPGDTIPRTLYAHVAGQGVLTLTYRGFSDISATRGGPTNAVHWWEGDGLPVTGCTASTISVVFMCDPGPPTQFGINFICDNDTWQSFETTTHLVRCPTPGPFEVDFVDVLTDPGCPAGCDTLDIAILTTS